MTPNDSVWTVSKKKPQSARYPPPTGDLELDVAIVGGGISGLTAALLLSRSGRRVAVFEKGTIGSGETRYSTAHISEVYDQGYARLIHQLGTAGARHAASAGRAAIDLIARIVAQDEIDCDWERVPAYLYSETGCEDDELREEWVSARRVGVRCRRLSEIGLPFPVHSALRYDDQAQFNPLKYLQGLAERAQQRGVGIYEHTPITSFTESEPCELETPQGRVRAPITIVTCHVPLQASLSLHKKLAAYRTYAIAVRSPHAENLGALYWDSMQPYHYVRSARVEGEPLLVIGGEDHRTGASVRTDKRYRQLELFARENFGATEVVAHWSGQILEPLDGLPYIGRSPRSPHVLIATGFGGQGITMGTVSGIMLSDLVRGERNEWEPLFSPRRVRKFGTYLARGGEYPKHYFSERWQERGELPLEAIPLGEGRVVKVGASKVAVYRDDVGELHALSSICPHMGCQVHWNRGEKSWDCPCHGSRFSTDGEILNGPACEGLARVEIADLNGSGRRRA